MSSEYLVSVLRETSLPGHREIKKGRRWEDVLARCIHAKSPLLDKLSGEPFLLLPLFKGSVGTISGRVMKGDASGLGY
jgi:hypothetical protein